MIGLCKTEATDNLSLGHAGQELLLLFFRAKLVNTTHGEGRLYAHAAAVARVDALNRTSNQTRCDRRDACTAISLDGGSKESKLTHLLKNLLVVVLITVGLCDWALAG